MIRTERLVELELVGDVRSGPGGTSSGSIGRLTQILNPVHEMIASERAVAGELRQRGKRVPELMAQLHKLADELDSNANEIARRITSAVSLVG